MGWYFMGGEGTLEREERVEKQGCFELKEIILRY